MSDTERHIYVFLKMSKILHKIYSQQIRSLCQFYQVLVSVSSCERCQSRAHFTPVFTKMSLHLCVYLCGGGRAPVPRCSRGQKPTPLPATVVWAPGNPVQFAANALTCGAVVPTFTPVFLFVCLPWVPAPWAAIHMRS